MSHVYQIEWHSLFSKDFSKKGHVHPRALQALFHDLTATILIKIQQSEDIIIENHRNIEPSVQKVLASQLLQVRIDLNGKEIQVVNLLEVRGHQTQRLYLRRIDQSLKFQLLDIS